MMSVDETWLDEVHGTSSFALAVVCCLMSFGLFFRSGMLWCTLAKLFEMEWCDLNPHEIYLQTADEQYNNKRVQIMRFLYSHQIF